MNDLVTFNAGLPVKPEDLLNGLQNVSTSLSTTNTGTPLLRLLKSGVFVYGPENIELQTASEWAINPHSLQHGFACWADSELLGEVMVPFNQPLPLRSELADYGADWKQQVAIQLQCLTGDDKGTTILYKGTSVGLCNAVKEMVHQLLEQLAHDKVNYVPVARMEVDSYTHKKWGEVFVPVIDIVRWISMDHTDVPDEGSESDVEVAAEEPPKAPARRRRRV